MLTISQPLNSGQAQTYHVKEFIADEQNYWKEGESIQGEWHGKLAPLRGEPCGESLRSLGIGSSRAVVQGR